MVDKSSLEEEHEFLAEQKRDLTRRMAINRALRGELSVPSPLDVARLLDFNPGESQVSSHTRILSRTSHPLVDVGRILCGEKLSRLKTRADRTYREEARRALQDFPHLLTPDTTTNKNRRKYFLDAESLKKYAEAKGREVSIPWKAIFG